MQVSILVKFSYAVYMNLLNSLW